MHSDRIFKWIYAGIFSLAAVSTSALALFCCPTLPQTVSEQVSKVYSELRFEVTQHIEAFHEHEQTTDTVPAQTTEMSENTASFPDTENAKTAFSPSATLGTVEDLDAFDIPEDFSGYFVMLDTALGGMMYFNQGDTRWAEYLYGGTDSMEKYGCGPTAVAMLVYSFSESGSGIDPIGIADWAAENGYYAYHSGSYHTLIENSLTHFGLSVESVTDHTYEYVSNLLADGHVLVALMKKGTLTDSSGHFILITKLLDNGNVWIADPNSYENTMKEWELDVLLSELKIGAAAGGPLWAVSN